MAKVYLTGAGPGDLDLLTIKALRVIQQADVIIYDNLANSLILKEAKDGCEFVYVGKEKDKHIMPQDSINTLIYEKSLESSVVVRLKGGDPFVFGRGGEEGLFLHSKGVEFEIIPGISSAIAVPAYAGIPVTHRVVAVSFRVVTGHEAPDKDVSQIPWESLKNDDTLVFLMGLHHLQKISQKLIAVGKPKNYPCAVISNGTTHKQEVVVSTLENIVEKSKGMSRPALIIVGEVVRLREQLDWFKA